MSVIEAKARLDNAKAALDAAKREFSDAKIAYTAATRTVDPNASLRGMQEYLKSKEIKQTP